MAATLSPPPKKLGVTHWSSRLLAAQLKVGNATIARAWRDYGIKPWRPSRSGSPPTPSWSRRSPTSSGSTWPRRRTRSCCAWTRSPRSRRWTAPRRSCRCARACPSATHDYFRHGTTTLFAALDIATGQVTATCKPRHRHQEFLGFLKQVARAYPDQELHLVMDNYAAHKRVEVRDWLAANPRIHVHFTPTHASWMNLVEVWFGIIERQAIRRGIFKRQGPQHQAPRLHRRLERPRPPFIWTKTADEILKKANRQKTSNTDH